MILPINKIKVFFDRRKELLREQRVLEYYEKNPGGLAGLVRDGQMVNRDKEARARQWVKEQEEKESAERKKNKWWERTWVQVVFLLGALAGIISLVIIFL